MGYFKFNHGTQYSQRWTLNMAGMKKQYENKKNQKTTR